MYIGVHKGTPDDGYVCSSKYMKEEYKSRPEDFFREILEYGTYSECQSKETELLKSVSAAKNPLYYNRHNGDGKLYAPEVMSEKTKQKIAASHKGRKKTEETKQRMSAAKRGTKLGPHTDEHRRKISQSCGNMPLERKQKIADAMRGKAKPPRTQEHIDKITAKKKNTIWINDGHTSRMIASIDVVPFGWQRGRIKWKGKQNVS